MESDIPLSDMYQSLLSRVNSVTDNEDFRQDRYAIHDFSLRLILWGNGIGEEDNKALKYIQQNHPTVAGIIRSRLQNVALRLEGVEASITQPENLRDALIQFENTVEDLMDLAESIMAYMGTANGKGMTAAIVKAYEEYEVGEPNLYVYVRWAADLPKRRLFLQTLSTRISTSIKIENAASHMSQMQNTELVKTPKSRRPSCTWNQKFAFFVKKDDVLLFEIIDYGNNPSKVIGTVIGQARLRLASPLYSREWALPKDFTLKIYGSDKLKSQGQLTIKLEPYTPPSAPVRKLLPSSPIASVVQGFEGIHTQENSFNEQNILTKPMESKIVNLLRCLKCSRSFEDSANLAYHTKRVHTIEDTPKKIIQIFNPPSAKPFELLRCHLCHKAFESATNRDYHIRRNHLIQCPSCSRDFEGPRNLAHHMTQSHPTEPKYYVYISQDHHVGLIKCPECNNRFQSSENLAWHIKHAHRIIMLRKCPQCHMSFKTHSELEKHFKECHPGGSVREISKPQSSYHGCVKCDKTFSCQESLSTHEREKHGSGHFTTQKPSSYSQQIEEASQDSCSEETTKTSIERAEQEECDRALAIRLQEEEEEKEHALQEQEKEREERDKHGPGSFDDLFGAPGMSTQDGIVSRIEEAETAILAYRDIDQWVEAILDQAEQDGNAISGIASSDMHSFALSKQKHPASSAPNDGPSSRASRGTDSPQLGDASTDVRPTSTTAASIITTDEIISPPVKLTKESSESLSMKAPARIADNKTIPQVNTLLSTARYNSSPEVTKLFANEAISSAEFQPVLMRTSSLASTVSSNTLSDRLSEFFLNRPDTNTGYSDAEIAEISRLLEYSVNSWSKVPRTYIILRTINCLHILEDLLAIGFSDHWFPVTFQNLPQLKSLTPTIGSAIVNNQDLILTKSIDLEKGEAGRHRHFAKGELLPFETIYTLGSGMSGRVDKVRSMISNKEYAIKRISRRNTFRRDPAPAVRAFINEVEILKRLKHRHIVEFVGSYTDSTYFTIVMSPVAEMDLAKHLSMAGPQNYSTLRTFFGCLTAALQYLHDNFIRHKDIKPQNILVDHGNVLLTDFGLSRDSSGAGSTTSGPTIKTPRYCAPEVAMFDSRNSSSDIWSLGCVFLEMLIVLKGYNIDWMNDYFDNHGSRNRCVHLNLDATTEIISKLKKTGSVSDNRVIEWVQKMLRVDRNARPTAAMLIASIAGRDKYGEVSNAFCGTCCSYEDELSEAQDSMDEKLFDEIEP